MSLRIIAALMFVSAGAVIGISSSEKLKDNRNICREIGEMFRISSVAIRYRGMNVYELASTLQKSESLKSLTFLQNISTEYSPRENFHQVWKKAAENQSGLLQDELKLICDFGRILGTSDIEGQLSSISALEVELNYLENTRLENYRQKGKLYRSLGVLFGVMVGIIVI